MSTTKIAHNKEALIEFLKLAEGKKIYLINEYSMEPIEVTTSDWDIQNFISEKPDEFIINYEDDNGHIWSIYLSKLSDSSIKIDGTTGFSLLHKSELSDTLFIRIFPEKDFGLRKLLYFQ